MKLVYLTSGAAGMYCGSCMHDNTLARAMVDKGADVMLTPTYTPIRTDENDVSIDRVFFGGISVFLQQKIPLFRHLPAVFDRLIDQPWLIRLATSKAVDTSPTELGALTVSMLKGRMGRQRKEVDKLCRWLKNEAKPDAVLLSNMLIAGCAPAIQESLDVPVVVTLQGDDIFLRELPEPFQSQAIAELGKLAKSVDGYLTHSRYYADFMADYLSLPRERIEVTPLGIDAQQYSKIGRSNDPSAPVVGYLARLAPEKGLHNLVEAFVDLHQRHKLDCRLEIAGWMGSHNQPYADEQFQKLRDAGLEDRFRYVGEVTRDEKIKFLSSVDVLSTPTDYHEPKGLFVLEALASGVPVVQPSHGAFPELVERLEGGLLYPPGDNSQLADRLAELIRDESKRSQLAKKGRVNVQTHHDAGSMADQTLDLIHQHIASRS